MLFAHDTVIGMARLVQVWIAPDVVRTVLAAGDIDRAAEVAGQLRSFAEEVVLVGSAAGHGSALLWARREVKER